MSIPPVRRSITVPWAVEAAFSRFTSEIATWWPYQSHSVGGDKVKTIVFEGQVGGRIYEDHVDGRRFLWGTVLEWDPPRRVRFTWHPGRKPETPTEVELTFQADGAGTRLELVHSGWERLGALGPKASKGYRLGWRYVLDVWAGRRTGFVVFMDLVTFPILMVQKVKRARRDLRNDAGGEITPART
ncbi:MAG: SRPBCC domain-containing protein [Gemmatimonadales bacterium]|nr:SRPBCC domain-containing protein [Gemmatimonadales bacterium]